MEIEVLYFDGCPNHSLAVERINEVLKEERISASVSGSQNIAALEKVISDAGFHVASASRS